MGGEVVSASEVADWWLWAELVIGGGFIDDGGLSDCGRTLLPATPLPATHATHCYYSYLWQAEQLQSN